MTVPAQTASSALPLGSRLGEFEVTGVIGEGGFGIVYSAHDRSLDRIVAIKEYLPSAFAVRTTSGTVQVRSAEHAKIFAAGLASFINEARMLGNFSHPGLVEVFQFWEANGTAYMVMRYYRSPTLREVLRTTPEVATEQWLRETLDPILVAVQELHAEQCYHRDISPDNILVGANGRSVLMDFGAARRIIGGMTCALTTVLKPGYAPIEQYSEDGSMHQGAWTDIYAVGGLLYNAMTGKVPVQAISRMMNDPLKSVSVAARSEYSEEFCRVVMKCLAVMPENRYQTIGELRAALGWGSAYTPSHDSDATQIYMPPAKSKIATGILEATDPLAQLRTSLNQAADFSSILEPQGVINSPGLPSVSSSMGLNQQMGLSDPSNSNVLVTKLPHSDSAPSGKAATPSQGNVLVPPRNRKISQFVIAGSALLSVIVLAVFIFFLPRPNPPPAIDLAQVKSNTGVEMERPVSSVLSNDAMQVTVPPQIPIPPVESVQQPESTVPEKAVEVSSDATEPPTNLAPTPTIKMPVKPVVALTGKIKLDIKPWGNISVNGVAKGASPPLKSLSLPPGTYTIEIMNPAGATSSQSIEVNAGKFVTVRHSFF